MITKIDHEFDGFFSEEEQNANILHQQQTPQLQWSSSRKEELRAYLPPAEEIKQKAYSLHPDMATGWAPKNQLPVPIPTIFNNKQVDAIAKQFIQQKQLGGSRVVYLGPRFENSFYAWYGCQFQFPYKNVHAYHRMSFPNRAYRGPMAEGTLVFDSHYESGNLDCAIQIGEHEYDLYVRVDSNTRGHRQWFSFKMRNLRKGERYRFNICNLEKKKSLYVRGQKPYIFSAKKYQIESKGWMQCGDSVAFQQLRDNEKGEKSPIVGANIRNYLLSFEYATEYDHDEIQVSYCIPYTYSQLLDFLNGLQKRVAGKNYLHISKLCLSLGGLEVPLLTIHKNYSKNTEAKLNHPDNTPNTHPPLPKKCVIVSGRVHPGESNSSHIMQGFLEYLCGQSKQAVFLRQHFVFKVIPMLNPDGVAIGNYRTGLSGRDFNREYRNPDRLLFPEVYHFKQLVLDTKKLYKQHLFMFLDFHGHSTKKNVFAYGPEFSITSQQYYECRVFPKLLGHNSDMFRYHACSFKIAESKQSTARAVFLRKAFIPLSYTIQASNGLLFDGELLRDVPFTRDLWLEMGTRVALTLAEYGEHVMVGEQTKISKIVGKKIKKSTKVGKLSKSRQKELGSSITPILIDHCNPKIKAILDQIKLEEQHECQDDEVSEGSSDNEDSQDDLTPQKLKMLFSIIKHHKLRTNLKAHKKYSDGLVQAEHEDVRSNRKNIHSKDTPKPPNSFQTDALELYFRVNPLQFEVIPEAPPLLLQKNEELQKPDLKIKGHLLKHRMGNISNMHSERKNPKLTAKIINFSFKGPSLREINHGEFQGSEVRTKIVSRNITNNSINKMLNFSQAGFRKSSYNINVPSPTRDIKSLSTGCKPEKRYKNLESFSPRKGIDLRMEELKFKKLFIDGDNLKV